MKIPPDEKGLREMVIALCSLAQGKDASASKLELFVIHCEKRLARKSCRICEFVGGEVHHGPASRLKNYKCLWITKVTSASPSWLRAKFHVQNVCEDTAQTCPAFEYK